MKMNRFVLQNLIPQPIRFGSMVLLASNISHTTFGLNAIILRPTTIPAMIVSRSHSTKWEKTKKKQRSFDVLAKATEVRSFHFVQHRLYLRLPLIRSKYQFYMFLFIWRVSTMKCICVIWIYASFFLCVFSLSLFISLKMKNIGCDFFFYAYINKSRAFIDESRQVNESKTISKSMQSSVENVCVRESPDHALSGTHDIHFACMHACMHASILRKYGMSSSFLMKCCEERRKKINVIITNSISDQFVTIIACMLTRALYFNQRYLLYKCIRYGTILCYYLLLVLLFMLIAAFGLWFFIWFISISRLNERWCICILYTAHIERVWIYLCVALNNFNLIVGAFITYFKVFYYYGYSCRRLLVDYFILCTVLYCSL